MLYQVKVFDAKLRVTKIISSEQVQARADENFDALMAQESAERMSPFFYSHAIQNYRRAIEYEPSFID